VSGNPIWWVIGAFQTPLLTQWTADGIFLTQEYVGTTPVPTKTSYALNQLEVGAVPILSIPPTSSQGRDRMESG
jgi:hypothetical protein